MAPAHLWITDRPIQPCDPWFRASPVPLVFRLGRPGICGLPRGCILQLIRLRTSTKLPWCPGCPGVRVAPGWCALQLCRRCVGELPRFPHPSALPAPEPQVTPLPGCSSLASPWFPRVAPASARSGFSGDGASGCPALSIHQHGRSGIPRVAPLPRSFSCASQCFRRVAPASAPSGCASDGVRGSPRVLASFGAAGAGDCELPRRSALPASPPDASTGSPRLSRPLALPRGSSSGCPESCCPQRCRFCVPRVAPWSCIGGWVDDESLAGSNFASSACAADESSRPIRSCTFLPDRGCCLNLIPSTYLAASRLPQIASCILLPSWNCVSNSLQGHQLFGE